MHVLMESRRLCLLHFKYLPYARCRIRLRCSFALGLDFSNATDLNSPFFLKYLVNIGGFVLDLREILKFGVQQIDFTMKRFALNTLLSHVMHS